MSETRKRARSPTGADLRSGRSRWVSRHADSAALAINLAPARVTATTVGCGPPPPDDVQPEDQTLLEAASRLQAAGLTRAYFSHGSPTGRKLTLLGAF